MSKPTIDYTNLDGNIFSVAAAASRALRHAGQSDKVTEMQDRITSSGSYTEALAVIMEYVDFTTDDESPRDYYSEAWDDPYYDEYSCEYCGQACDGSYCDEHNNPVCEDCYNED